MLDGGDGPILAAFHQEFHQNHRFKGNAINTQSRGRQNRDDQDDEQNQGQLGQFRRLRVQVLTSLLENINRRFPRMDLVDAMQVQ